FGAGAIELGLGHECEDLSLVEISGLGEQPHGELRADPREVTEGQGNTGGGAGHRCPLPSSLPEPGGGHDPLRSTHYPIGFWIILGRERRLSRGLLPPRHLGRTAGDARRWSTAGRSVPTHPRAPA